MFRARFEDRSAASSPTAAPSLDPTSVATRPITFPGDEEGLDALRAEFQRIDALQHR